MAAYRGVQASPSRKLHSRRVLAPLALLVATASLLVYFYTFYTGGLRLSLAGVTITSSQIFRPALIACISWCVLAWLAPHLPGRKDVAVVLVCLVAYSFPQFDEVSGDVVPSEYTALAMATGAGTSLDSYRELTEDGLPYFVSKTPKGLRSSYPLGPALLAWPVYLPAPYAPLPRAELVDRLGRLAAILIALAGVWLALRIAQKLQPPLSPHLLALVYGLGTSHWPVSSTELWQHGPGEVWLLGAIDRIVDDKAALGRRLAATGACLALAVFTRPPLAGPAVLILAFLLWRFGKRSAAALGAAAAIGSPLAFYNGDTYGSLLGPYGGHLDRMLSTPVAVWAENLYWIAFSPSRGIFWYEPVVLLTLALAAIRVRRFRERPYLFIGLAGFVLLWVSYSRWFMWWGGHCFGPRLMTDALPLWFLAFASLGPVTIRFSKSVLVASTMGAVLTLIHFWGPSVRWNQHPSVDWFPDRVESFGDSLLLANLTALWPGNHVRSAVEAQRQGNAEEALKHWRKEWAEHPWHGFAAVRIADLLVRTGRLHEAHRHTALLVRSGRETSYFRHLSSRLPAIIRLLESPEAKLPAWVRSSRNKGLVQLAHDASLDTGWSTEHPQRRTDWLELGTDPEVPVRGIALLSIPEFGHGPTGLVLFGSTPSGEVIRLGEHRFVKARLKGWVTMRFPPIRLSSIWITLPRDHATPWTVSELRLLVSSSDLTGEPRPRRHSALGGSRRRSVSHRLDARENIEGRSVPLPRPPGVISP